MNIETHNLSIYAGNDEKILKAKQMQQQGEKAQFNGKSINAQNLRLMPDSIAEKKESAQKKAWKLISNANEQEGKIDDQVSEMEEKIEELTGSSVDTLKEINQINENLASLKDEYHVADGSQEQKDLDLLMKQQEKMQGGDVTLTDEETKRLEEMGEPTDYQKRALGYSETLHTKNAQIEMNNNAIKGIKEGITAIGIDRCKTHGMVDAKVESDKMVASASKEAINGLLKEGKDKLDDKIEEKKEEAEKKADEKKAEEEKKEAAEKEEEVKAAQGDTTAKAADGVQTQSTADSASNADAVDVNLATDAATVQQKITNILKEDKLLSEDIKGIAVDANL